MRGINKVTILGHLGADPETRFLENGTAVATISVATSEKWKDKTTGEEKERTEWHRISFFGRLAEVAGEYLRKGSPVYLEGKLQTRKWTDKEGVDRWTTEILAREMRLLGQSSGSGGSRPPSPPPHQDSDVAPDLDDDIPF